MLRRDRLLNRLRTSRSGVSRLKRLRQFRSIAWIVLIVVLLAGYWLLPISGRLVIVPDNTDVATGNWPQTWIDPPVTRAGEETTLYVRDNQPWAYVQLMVNGVNLRRDESYAPGNGPWTWRWRVRLPAQPGAEAVFYHSCHTGCIERTRTALGEAQPVEVAPRTPTKLGVVFASMERDWHNRAGWSVELTYVLRQDDVDFSIDGLAQRVQQATRLGLRVLVRVAYDRQQSLPPAGDEVALAQYLAYCQRLVRDDRLNAVYGYSIGNGFNALDENKAAPDRPTTPEWYARLFNGYSVPRDRTDNVLQQMRALDPQVRVLVGSVTPWNTDQNGDLRDPLDLPWLNYFNTLVAHLAAATEARSAAGIALAAPDGFALQAPGRVDAPAPEVAERPYLEPATVIRRDVWGEAQAGFRVYQNWLAIINREPTLQGLPAFITATNTWTNETQVPPAQNYPTGWLTTALDQINREPQVQALCWFVDAPLGAVWQPFSLHRPQGRMNEAGQEFDRLLQQ